MIRPRTLDRGYDQDAAGNHSQGEQGERQQDSQAQKEKPFAWIGRSGGRGVRSRLWIGLSCGSI